MKSSSRAFRACALASAAVLSLLLSSCAGGGAGDPSDGGDGLVLKVGLLEANNPLYAELTPGVRTVAEIAPELIDVPGVTVETVLIPTDGTPENVIQSVQRAVQQDGITVVTGFATSAAQLALVGQAAQLGVIVMDAFARTTDTIGAQCTPNYFKVTFGVDQYTLGTLAAAETAGAKVWDAMATDDAYGHGTVDSFAKFGAEDGVSFRTVAYAPPGTTDLAPYISTLSEDPADLLLLSIGGTDGVNFTAQAKQFGLFDKYKSVITAGLMFPQSLKANGATLVGAQEVVPWMAANGAPGAEEFADKYNEAITDGTSVYWTPAASFISIQVAAQAAASSGSVESDALVDAISGTTFETIGGPFEFRAEDHLGVSDGYLIQAQEVDGEYVPVVVATLPAADITPPPNPACKLP